MTNELNGEGSAVEVLAVENLAVKGLKIDPEFAAFIKEEALPGLSIDERDFWQGGRADCQ